MELYKKYRPTSLDDMVGQDEAVRVLSLKLKRKTLPHALMFTGGSGCGKTSAARIVANRLGCIGTDLREMDCADTRGIDDIRKIGSAADMTPWGGRDGARVFILDECHKLSGAAQNALLKILEDEVGFSYFILCTTDPEKVIKTVANRCTEIRFGRLPDKLIEEMVIRIARKEAKLTLCGDVAERIAEVADGSARAALVILDKVLEFEGDSEQLNCILSNDSKAQIIDLCKLLWDNQSDWNQVRKVLKGMSADPEEVRYRVLGMTKAAALNNSRNLERYYKIIVAFESNFYDSKDAGLIRACMEVVIK